MNTQQHENDFRAAIAKEGLTVKGPLIADGKWQYCDVAGDKPGKKNGRYRLYLDGTPRGLFRNWKDPTGQTIKWSADRGTTPMSAAERERIDATMARRAAKEADDYNAAAKRARRDWDAANAAPADHHPYLTKKGIEAHGTRVDGQGRLIIPVMIDGAIVSLQRITRDGGKKFMAGGRTAGGSFPIGDVAAAQQGTIVFCEGFATGASIHEATGHPVIVAFNCGGLEPVIGSFRAQYPNARFVIAADNDQWTKGNPGLTAARAAAKAHNCLVAAPVFADLDGKPTDFNDLHAQAGREAVADALREAVAEPIPGPVESEQTWAPLAPHFNEPSVSADEAAVKLRAALREFFRRLAVFLDYKSAMAAAVAQADIKAEAEADYAMTVPGIKGILDERAAYAEVCRISRVAPADDMSDEGLDGLRDRVTEKFTAEFRRFARERVRKDHRDINCNLPAPPRLQVKATPGLGKTTIVAELLRAHPEWHAHLYSPTHDLIDGTAKHLPEGRRIRGRAQAVAPGSTEKMCTRAEIAEEVQTAGLSVKENLCERGNKRCAHFDGCQYLAQWENTEPGATLFPTASLPIPKPPEFPKPDLVIVDESAQSELIAKPKRLDPDRLTETGWMHDLADSLDRVGPHAAVDMSADIAFAAGVMRKVHDALCDTGNELATLRAAGVTQGDLLAARKCLNGLAERPKLDPTLSDSEIRRRLGQFKGSDAGKVAAMLRALALEIDLPRSGTHGVVLRDTEVPVDGEYPILPRIHVFATRKPRFDAGKTALLILDADADIEVNRRLFSADVEDASDDASDNADEDDGEVGDIETVDIRAEQRAHVVQYYSTVMPKGRAIRDSADGESVRAQLRALVDRETAGGKKVLVITYRDLRRKLTGQKDPTTTSTTWNGAEIAHFGNIRGKNDFENYDAVIIFGRNQPPLGAMEDMARAVFADAVRPLELLPTASGDADDLGDDDEAAALARPSELRAYRMAAGHAEAVKVDCHPDPRVQGFWEQKREDETGQSIGRLRLVHAAKPKRVIIVSSVPVDITVNEALHMREVLKSNPVMEAYGVSGRALRLNPSHLAETYPAQFKSEGHARDHARAAKKRFGKRGGNPNNISIGNFPPFDPSEPEIVRYRVEGQKGVDAYGLADPRSRPDEKFAAQAGKPIIGYVDRLNVSSITFSPDYRHRTKEEIDEDEVGRLLEAGLNGTGDVNDLFRALTVREPVPGAGEANKGS